LKAAGGTSSGALVPLGTADYSAYLIQAKAYGPQVLINVMGGGDQVSSLKQFVQFGLDKQMRSAHPVRTRKHPCRAGWRNASDGWTMEWWWTSRVLPHVAEFNTAIKKITGVRSDRPQLFGYASVQTLALIANQEKTLDAPKWPAHSAVSSCRRKSPCSPGRLNSRRRHELMSTVFVGEAHPPQGDPDKMFSVRNPIRRKGRRSGRGHRLQDAMAGLT